MVPFFIICRNRVSWLKSLISWVESLEGISEIYLLDSASTYPPLLDFYTETNHTVLRSTTNHGHLIGWKEGYLREYSRGRRFVLTDHDVYPSDECPPDIINKMNSILDASNDILKVGPSLVIDDIPNHYQHKQEVLRRQAQFWSKDNYDKNLNVFTKVGIDTTMAMYQPHGSIKHEIYPSYRIGPPYTLKHLPWYNDLDNLDAEEQYYHTTASSEITNWCKN